MWKRCLATVVLTLCVVACGGDEPDPYVVSRAGDDAGPDAKRPGRRSDADAAARDGGAPISSEPAIFVASGDEDAGIDVGAADPAPGVDLPGNVGCDDGPVSEEAVFVRDLDSATSTVLSGTVMDADGDGRFYVESEAGQSLGGAVRIDPDTGDYSVEVPLFCGTQTVKLVWTNDACQLVIVYEITTDACETDLRITLAWDELGYDFELHLIREGGRINDNADDCTWTSCIGSSPDWGVEGSSGDDPTKDVDNTGTFGPENVLLTHATAGNYTVMVEHWGVGDPTADGEVTINARDRPATVVRIRDLAPQWVFTAARIEWPGGRVTPVERYFDCTAQWSGGCQAPIP